MKGAAINAKDNLWSRTPLHWAVETGNKDIVELLMSNGANMNVKDNLGKTPLAIAEERKHKEIAELLRKHGGE